MTHRTLAIACQGGGSHCAFGAGVLVELLSQLDNEYTLTRNGERYRVIGLSGTSGGAINSLCAWYGLIHPAGPEVGRRAMFNFWHEMSANTIADRIANFFAVQSLRLRGVLPQLEVAPSHIAGWAHHRMRQLLEQQIPFAQLPTMAGTSAPKLLIGAANVLTGKFHVFGKYPLEYPRVEEILASTAVPTLYDAVEVDGQPYWDGLLSQNPPVRDFFHGNTIDEKPDAVWVIRINPSSHRGVPKRLNDITDRQNEMAGNISLEQEKFFISRVTEWVLSGRLQGEYKAVAWEEICMDEASETLDYASKLDRDPAFIEGLIALGRSQARLFLNG